MVTHKTIEYTALRDCVVALGCFDGVHRGHLAVINTAKELAEKLSLPLDILTFDIPPRSFFSNQTVPQIIPTEEKLRIFESLGAENTLCLPASAEIFSMSAEDFVEDILLSKMRARHLVCGFDYSFGKGGRGDHVLLRSICEKHNVYVTVIPEITFNDIPVSSSLIRESVLAGNVEKAGEFLGRPFSITQKVVDGQHLARRLGFPTVNMIPAEGALLPKNGVYLTKIVFDGQIRHGITNVGLRPTVNTHLLCAETHIFDFDGDLYGKELRVEFLKFIREERKFENITLLSEQVKKDIADAKTFMETKKDR